MKNLALIVAFVTLSFGAFAQKKAKYETVKIKTSAICDMCKNTIEKALAYEKGIKKSDLDVDTKVVTVTYNPDKTNPDKIRKAISMAGYDADNVVKDPVAFKNLDECCKKDGCEDKGKH